MLECCLILAQAIVFVFVILLAIVIRALPLIAACAGTWAAVEFLPAEAVPAAGLIGLASIVVAAFLLPAWGDLLGAWTEGRQRTLDDGPMH